MTKPFNRTSQRLSYVLPLVRQFIEANPYISRCMLLLFLYVFPLIGVGLALYKSWSDYSFWADELGSVSMSLLPWREVTPEMIAKYEQFKSKCVADYNMKMSNPDVVYVTQTK